VTHLTDTIATIPYQFIGDIDAVRIGDSTSRRKILNGEYQNNEIAYPFSYHNRLSVETSVTFRPL